MKRRHIAGLVGLALGGALVDAAMGQTYPSKPVRLMVGFAPGGPVDVVARLIAPELQTALHAPSVYVENRPGASGSIALHFTKGLPADGYTVLLTSNTQVVYQLTNKAAGYDMDKDLAPVIKVASTPNAIVAAPGLGARTLKDVLDLSRKKQLNFGTAGTASTPHLTLTYLFHALAKVDIQHVPYAGGGPALTAVVGNQLDLAGVALTPAVPMIQTGRAVGIALTSARRIAALPDVPTVAEQGFPGFEDETWVGMFVAAGTPQAVIAKINEAVRGLLNTKAIQDKLRALAFEPEGGTARDFKTFLAADRKKWATYIQAAGVTIE